MYLIFAAIVVAFLSSCALFMFGDDGYDTRHTLAALAGVFLGIASAGTAIIYAFSVWQWIASEHKTQIINREYGVNYTREEVFFASDVIETIRQLDRKRYEVNGDLMRGAKKAK